MKKKIKEFVDLHPRTIRVVKVLGSVVLFSLAYKISYSRGKDNFIEELIHNYENGGSWEEFTYSSSDPAFGDLMYEIKCECIGD